MTAIVTVRDRLTMAKYRILGTAAAGSGLVAAASASTDINASVGPVLDGVIALLPTLLALVLAALPIIICMMIVGFLTGFFDGIIGKFRI